jgi:hypothetical protein
MLWFMFHSAILIKLLSISVERWGHFLPEKKHEIGRHFGWRSRLEFVASASRMAIQDSAPETLDWTHSQKRIPSFNTGDPTEFQQCSRRKLLLLFGTMAARNGSAFLGPCTTSMLHFQVKQLTAGFLLVFQRLLFQLRATRAHVKHWRHFYSRKLKETFAGQLYGYFRRHSPAPLHFHCNGASPLFTQSFNRPLKHLANRPIFHYSGYVQSSTLIVISC